MMDMPTGPSQDEARALMNSAFNQPAPQRSPGPAVGQPIFVGEPRGPKMPGPLPTPATPRERVTDSFTSRSEIVTTYGATPRRLMTG